MSEFVMQGADVRVLLWHMALYGLGAILEDAGVEDVRLSWTRGMQPRGAITATGLSRDVVDDIVREHAKQHVTQTSWLLRDVQLRDSKGKTSVRALMSPRLSTFGGRDVWQGVQAARHREIDQLSRSQALLDLRLVAALGEPCYWSRDRLGKARQDDGASRLEMQPRNSGSEFVTSRLRKLAKSVAAREQGRVTSGLAGVTKDDESERNKFDSRTPTGMASIGPTDNAVAWCALWGISQMPIASRVNKTVLTSGHIGGQSREWFYVPVWTKPWSSSRLRSILSSRQLLDAASRDLPGRWRSAASEEIRSRRWLAARHVDGIMRFDIEQVGKGDAAERRAMHGVPISTEAS